VDRKSHVETFAAVRLHIDSWRWSDVPFYIRSGKRLPVTAAEIPVDLRLPPQTVFDSIPVQPSNYIRFRLSPNVVISLSARAVPPGEAMVGEEVELIARHQSGGEMTAYERLLGDAMRGDASLFARGSDPGRRCATRPVEACEMMEDEGLVRSTTHSPTPGLLTIANHQPGSEHFLAAASCGAPEPIPAW